MQARPYIREISLKREKVTDFGEYPFNIPAIGKLGELEFHPKVTFLVGENGTGKSTLIEAIAVAMGFSAEGGTRNFQVATADTVSILHQCLKVVKSFAKPKDYYFLRAESFYNVATYMDTTGYLGGYGDRSLHERSHGEAFMATLTMKLRGNGLYIFDEPEAALSPMRQMAALSAIHELVKKESQFIIATHSPILLAYPDSKIIFLDDGGISEISYEETEHYVITKNFLNNHRKLLRTIFTDDDST
jgi:predicted ATPase